MPTARGRRPASTRLARLGHTVLRPRERGRLLALGALPRAVLSPPRSKMCAPLAPRDLLAPTPGPRLPHFALRSQAERKMTGQPEVGLGKKGGRQWAGERVGDGGRCTQGDDLPFPFRFVEHNVQHAEKQAVCVSLTRAVIICLASTHTYRAGVQSEPDCSSPSYQPNLGSKFSACE